MRPSPETRLPSVSSSLPRTLTVSPAYAASLRATSSIANTWRLSLSCTLAHPKAVVVATSRTDRSLSIGVADQRTEKSRIQRLEKFTSVSIWYCKQPPCILPQADLVTIESKSNDIISSNRKRILPRKLSLILMHTHCHIIYIAPDKLSAISTKVVDTNFKRQNPDTPADAVRTSFVTCSQ